MSFAFGRAMPTRAYKFAVTAPPVGGNGDGSALNDQDVDFNLNETGSYFTAIDGSALNDSSIDFDLETA